jgi:flagellar basal body-associated protein FliL
MEEKKARYIILAIVVVMFIVAIAMSTIEKTARHKRNLSVDDANGSVTFNMEREP